MWTGGGKKMQFCSGHSGWRRTGAALAQRAAGRAPRAPKGHTDKQRRARTRRKRRQKCRRIGVGAALRPPPPPPLLIAGEQRRPQLEDSSLA